MPTPSDICDSRYQPRTLELLAPARDVATAREAILHGADAVYIGGPSHGARAAASNSISDIASLCRMAHLYGVKVYVTLNTIIYPEELKDVEQTVTEIYNAGVDALIVQDMGLLRMNLPPIDLHASTQCDIRTPEKAEFLSRCGFSQLVLPRELSLQEIIEMRKAVAPDTALEAFIHGALCVSYSGDCQASWVAKKRSANRGECAQMCRLAYNLTDAEGNVLMKDKHLLSLRDLCRIADIEALADAGVSSFKIEGRLKDAAYVKTTVGAYRRAIDEVIAKHPDKYRRASRGVSILKFTPDLEKAFNRGYTSYFLRTPEKMVNLNTPKWVGEKVATVSRCTPQYISIKLLKPINNGDGVGYFSRSGQFTGFHVNRADGNRIYPASPQNIPEGATLYRNRDIKADALMAQATASRLIDIDIRLSYSEPDTLLTLTLSAVTDEEVSVSASTNVTLNEAKSPQTAPRHTSLNKLGDTPFKAHSIADTLSPMTFVPLSVITRLRQQATSMLEDALVKSHKRAARRTEDTSAKAPKHTLTYHDNVANHLAGSFYESHGAEVKEPAIETQKNLADKEITVMTTRYCIRRELGACLRTPQGRNLPHPLFISNPTARYRLDFDCKNCCMKLIHSK